MKRTYDAILLLGLRLNPDGSAQEEMLLRSKKAAELWKAGVAPVIVACGGPTGGSGRTEAEVLKEELVSLGVAESAVLLEDRSMITTENIVNARKILGADRRNVALVTSDYHVFRSRLICRRLGFRVKGFGAPTQGGQARRDNRRLEAMFTADMLLGWDARDKKRPKWAETLRRRVAMPILRRRGYTIPEHEKKNDRQEG